MARVVRVATTCQLCIGSPDEVRTTVGLGDGPIEYGGNAPSEFSRQNRSVWDDEDY